MGSLHEMKDACGREGEVGSRYCDGAHREGEVGSSCCDGVQYVGPTSVDCYREKEAPACKRLRLMAPNQQWIELDLEKESTQPSPLGLKLRKTPSFMELVQAKLFQGQPPKSDEKQNLQHGIVMDKVVNEVLNTPSVERMKASNFIATFLKIGSWERASRYDGDLVAKCYFAKRKLVWEVLEGGLKSKIEIQWSDITSLRTTYRQNHPDQLEVELSKVPHLFRETNPQPRKHTLWQAANDFTGGQAVAYRNWWILLTAKNRVSAILMMGTLADVNNIMNQLTVEK
ncbi:hypothetical protein EJ110_NYTH57735 [Nymphaea thermarum]|nr:hypothetical protein EJ110_NYTH57735 [Nymphaea thermarum]